jgi:Ricin-type beta-trefoil lectin domain-like
MKRLQLLTLVFGSVTALFAQGGFNGPGRYVIRNVQSRLALDLRGNELTQSARNSPSQVWILQQVGPDVFTMRNAAAGCALEFDQDRNGSAVHCTNGRSDNQHWRFEPAGNGVLIISRFRKPLDIPDGSNREGIRVQIYDRNGDSNQRFVMEQVGGPVEGFGVDRRDRDRRDDDRRDGGPVGRIGAQVPAGQYFDEREQMWRIDDGVCFYRGPQFRGEAVCLHTGEVANDFRAGGGAFQSLKLFGRVREVEIFERNGLRGGVIRLNHDEPDLRRVRAGWAGSIGDGMGSFRVN